MVPTTEAITSPLTFRSLPTLSHQNLNFTTALERKIAACFLGFVVLLQVLNALTAAIERSKGRGGRFLYYIAFCETIIHDFFVGIIVPISLIWVSYQLYHGTLQIEPLVTMITGALWYGPERVQQSITNLIHLKRRIDVLCVALSPYHRSRNELNAEDRTTTIVRYRCRLPLFSFERVEDRITNTNKGRGLLRRQSSRNYVPETDQENAVPSTTRQPSLELPSSYTPSTYIQMPITITNRDVYSQSVQRKLGELHSKEPTSFVVRHDKDLRSVARVGVRMALRGHFSENDLRDWLVVVVADQARFPLSPLEEVLPSDVSIHDLCGYGATRFKRKVQEVQERWSDEEWRKLITVYQGIRNNGLPYVRRGGWAASSVTSTRRDEC